MMANNYSSVGDVKVIRDVERINNNAAHNPEPHSISSSSPTSPKSHRPSQKSPTSTMRSLVREDIKGTL